MNQLPIKVIVLTFNSEDSIAQVLDSCLQLSTDFLVVDSFSTDKTVDIARSYNCEVVQHEFENYSRQRNWAQNYASLDDSQWVLHLDSDEILSDQLAISIQKEFHSKLQNVDGYLFRRLPHFLGQPIKYGHLHPNWHLRLFRSGKGKCEDRLYDQHFIVNGSTKQLSGWLLDLQITSIDRWTATHNRWSSLEAQEIFNRTKRQPKDSTLQAKLWGDSRMQKRWLKNNVWYRLPLLLRPFIFFVYSYFIKLGFLDGRIGLIHSVLQAFWFRFLVDVKILELNKKSRWTNL
ncbi:glycosyltransferase family 2 protein [Thermosynechococcaceae cyanobacterium BACA0444]|uniref:Glycosyltransferase family 2 protein n=1 Tax=Pseudocalidococcus azoricus BACA0444 TaxID=2918990 RepID=A0AAE4FNI0_9CYAN|nr:glycosyltransferase family 2 protein [Pseudocalidococcus azoricus]MDS3859235.1 glycosyltransferase family 2 protein [Pseudocalidococcus azoricus BACA0444]